MWWHWGAGRGTGSAVFRHRFRSIFFLLSLCPPRPQRVFLLLFDCSPLMSNEIPISCQLTRCCQGSASSRYPSAPQLRTNPLPATAKTPPGRRYATARNRYFFHPSISTTKSSKLFSATSDFPELRGCPGFLAQEARSLNLSRLQRGSWFGRNPTSGSSSCSLCLSNTF